MVHLLSHQGDSFRKWIHVEEKEGSNLRRAIRQQEAPSSAVTIISRVKDKLWERLPLRSADYRQSKRARSSSLVLEGGRGSDMPPSAAAEWRGKAGGFLSSSSLKLRQATQAAGIVVGDAAKNAGSSMAEAAERAGSVVRSRWSLLQLQQQQHQQQQAYDASLQDRPSVQERFRNASIMLKKQLQDTKELAIVGFLDTKEKAAVGLVETKEKLAVGKIKVEEAARKAAQRSKTLMQDWRQKGAGGKGAFGVSLDVLVQRQKSTRPIPSVVIKCVDFLVLSGLNAEYIFKKDGNHRVVDRLIASLNEDPTASMQGASPIDVAALLKVFLHMLPEPILLFENYEAFASARGNVVRIRQLVSALPPANYFTLECLTALLLRISQKSTVNKMDSHSLAFELAPALLWQKGKVKSSRSGKSRATAAGSLRSSRLTPVIERPREEAAAALSEDVSRPVSIMVDMDGAGAGSEDVLFNEHTGDDRNGDLSAQIPLDDDEPLSVDFSIVEAVQCLIDQHNVIFADAVEVVWQELGS
ncbi:hypothetical protein R1flu_017065 [Riccia fluitans]|uniref:Rho-GAP domain-containing protein n=1 Tax=Riccia fluitans TaxID=41844 RepID=A0ABD1YRN8_9MARC